MLNSQAKLVIKEGISQKTGKPYKAVQALVTNGNKTSSVFVPYTQFERDWVIDVLNKLEEGSSDFATET